ncbi:hypothetical protein BDV29DRAFT_152742 [Aspergillus leporis]|uniref:Uncharacterized protein n=1 Tax=Aspergillus leporis TaxID=41062 RepID=A0A5N5XE60_9EURO|nr:hypothetical protein BDV29DRAFT_152742 [Aspergillus leporis]
MLNSPVATHILRSSISDFIDPDDLVEKAHDALLPAKLLPCTRDKRCFHRTALLSRPHAPQPVYFKNLILDSEFQGAVYIYKQSDYFFSITDTPGPEIPPGSPAPDDPYFMLATDPRLTGKDRFDAGMHPVKISLVYIWLLYMADEEVRGHELLKKDELNP